MTNAPTPSATAHQLAQAPAWAGIRAAVPPVPSNPATRPPAANYFGLSPESMALVEECLAKAPPLSQAEIDVISTIFGWTPADLDTPGDRQAPTFRVLAEQEQLRNASAALFG